MHIMVVGASLLSVDKSCTTPERSFRLFHTAQEYKWRAGRKKNGFPSICDQRVLVETFYMIEGE